MFGNTTTHSKSTPVKKSYISKNWDLTRVLVTRVLFAGLMLTAPCLLPATAGAAPADLKQRLLEVDAKLNQEYQKLRKSRTPTASNLLLDEQKKWLKRRDDACKIAGLPDQREQWIAGIATNPEQARCVIDKARTRIKSFEENQKSSPSVVFDYRPHGEIVEQSIRDIVKNSGFSLTNKTKEELCKTFFDDFIKDRNIYHIRPMIETDDYNDSSLSPYKENCPLRSKDLRTVFTVPVHDPTDFDNVDEIPDYADIFIGQDNFKIFELDLDQDGKEDSVFYYENELHIKSKKIFPTRVYRSVIPNSCRKKLFINFNQFGSATRTRNGVISYKGRNGIFVMESGKVGTAYYGVLLYMHTPERRDINLLCQFSRKIK